MIYSVCHTTFALLLAASTANSACRACKMYEQACIQKLLYQVDWVLPTYYSLVDCMFSYLLLPSGLCLTNA